jgi:lipoate-protein ligase B
VGYPICDLGTQDHDLHRFLRSLELALVDALAGWGVEGRQVPGRTGIWVGEDKIASIGIAVRRWVTYHGFALNVRPNLAEFDVIHPCGLRGIRMTSLERLIGGECPTLFEARRVVAEALAARLGYSGAVWEGPEAAWKAAGEQPVESETRSRWNPTAA